MFQKLKYLTFEEALIGAQDSDLHPALRSKYVELIVGQLKLTLYYCLNGNFILVHKVLYIDVGDNRAFLDSLPLSFVSCLNKKLQ